ncbi:MAG: hypothetical protein KF725_13535 [Cyclobacteriaceae bacterium]|nr:hypothetical protein [Cyclobacteriaceae bacterium]UYN85355.1 MAG: hypothetical protein KIT51_10680 [Cyclobacteriaceae bacterium]
MRIKKLFLIVCAFLFLGADLQAATATCINETYEQEAFDFTRTRNFGVARAESQRSSTTNFIVILFPKPEKSNRVNFSISEKFPFVQSLTILFQVFRI